MPPPPAPGIPTCCVKRKDGADRIRPKETRREGGDSPHPTAPPPALRGPAGTPATGAADSPGASPRSARPPRPARPRPGEGRRGAPVPAESSAGRGRGAPWPRTETKGARSSAAAHLGGRGRLRGHLPPQSSSSFPTPRLTLGPGARSPGSAPPRVRSSALNKSGGERPRRPRCPKLFGARRASQRAGPALWKAGEARRCARSGTPTSGQRARGCRRGGSAARRCRRPGGAATRPRCSMSVPRCARGRAAGRDLCTACAVGARDSSPQDLAYQA